MIVGYLRDESVAEYGRCRSEVVAPRVAAYGVQTMRSCIPLFNVTVVGAAPVTSK